jgi:hypothetical protein
MNKGGETVLFIDKENRIFSEQQVAKLSHEYIIDNQVRVDDGGVV